MPSPRPALPVRSLYARLALVLLAVLVLVGAGWIAAATLTTRLYQEEVEQRLNRDLARQLLKDTALLEEGLDADALGGGAAPPAGAVPPALEHIFHVLMVVNPRIEVYLLAPDGRILAYSAPEGRVVRQRVDLGPVRAFLQGTQRLPIRGDDPRSAGGRKIFSAAAIPAAGGEVGGDPDAPAGYLYVVLGGEQYESVVARLRSSYILRLAAGVAAGALAVALVAGLVLFRRLTRRLEALDERIRAFRPADDPDAPPGDRPGDEIDRLEAAFARMRERIERQVGELAALDEMRRELVANVSHDLRTPLAALSGYLETLQLKDGELEPEQRREYLAVALRHSEQLSHLVERLFELARLDVEEARLELEAVSLAELAQDVVQKFDLDARRLGVALHAELPRRLPPVRGDIRLLERVLDNLIENALAHTPSGGRVRVEVRETGEGVEVRLADTGAGIPHDELPRVFERFHRGRDPGRRRRPGAGLGLAISQRILELHGADLEVESAVGRGTTFTFRLRHTEH